MTNVAIMPCAQNPKLIKCAMPDGIPETILKLQRLPPDESLRYYLGDLDRDIDRSMGVAPNYCSLLELLRQTVAVLEQRHRIVVVTELQYTQRVMCKIAGRRQDVKVYSYTATGVRLG